MLALSKKRLTPHVSMAMIIVFALVLFPATIGYTEAFPNKDIEEKDYAPGELVVKFKPGHEGQIPEEIAEVEKKEKLFPGIPEPHAAKDTATKNFPHRARRVAQGEMPPDLTSIYHLKVPKDADVLSLCEELSNLPYVEYAEPNYLIEIDEPDVEKAGTIGDPRSRIFPFALPWGPDDPLLPDQWALINTGQFGGTPDADIDAELGWGIERGDSQVTIAIIDSGVAYTHEDLRSKLWRNPGEIPFNGIDDEENGFVDDVIGWDFFSGDNDPMDREAHGTSCAGIAGAATDNGKGIAGVAPNCPIMAVRVSHFIANEIKVAQGVVYAAENGADVLSNSWGQHGYLRLWGDCMDYAHSLGCVSVCAAGNSHENSIDNYPSSLRSTIGVGATNDSDERCSFSNYGHLVDLYAPADEPGVLTTFPRDRYWKFGGTSGACPHVSAAAALIISKDLRDGVVDFTNEDIRQILCSSADDLGEPGWDLYTSNGRLNLVSALMVDDVPKCEITYPSDNRSYFNGVIDIEGKACGTGFISYRIEYGEGHEPEDWNLIVNSTEQVENGVLASVDTSGVEEGEYLIRLSVDARRGTGIHTFTFHMSVFVNHRVQPGWPQRGNVTMTTPAVADLDGGGTPEIIAADWHGTVFAWEPDGTEFIDGDKDPSTNGVFAHIETWPRYSDPVSSVKVCDLDGDGDREVVVGSNADPGRYTGNIYAWHHDANIVSGWPPEHTGEDWDVRGTPAIGDMDNDGKMEVAANVDVYKDGGDEARTYLWDHEGDAIDGWPKVQAPGNGASTAMGDMDGDSCLELVVPFDDIIYAWEKDGRDVEGWEGGVEEEGIWPSDVSCPAVGDLDHDCMDDVVLASRDGNVYAWYGDGSEIPGWPQFYSGGSDLKISSVTLADIAGNSDMEILVGSLDNAVYAWYVNGEEVIDGDENPSTHGVFAVTEDRVIATPTVANVKGLLGPEIVVGDHSGKVYAWNCDGTPVPGWPMEIDLGTEFQSAVADIDGDGGMEVTSNGGSFLWIWDGTGPGMPFGVECGQSRYDSRNSGVYVPSTTLDYFVLPVGSR